MKSVGYVRIESGVGGYVRSIAWNLGGRQAFFFEKKRAGWKSPPPWLVDLNGRPFVPAGATLDPVTASQDNPALASGELEGGANDADDAATRGGQDIGRGQVSGGNGSHGGFRGYGLKGNFPFLRAVWGQGRELSIPFVLPVEIQFNKAPARIEFFVFEQGEDKFGGFQGTNGAAFRRTLFAQHSGQSRKGRPFNKGIDSHARNRNGVSFHGLFLCW